jgi:hypothetical protein
MGVLLAAEVCAQSNFVMFMSFPGDALGQGKTYVTANLADFIVSGSPAVIQVQAFGFTCWFAGPGGTNLAVGEYPDCVRYRFNGSSPGLDIYGMGRGCSTVCGSFEIKELHTDDAGQVDRLWLIFTNICGCEFHPPPMTGEIRYNSQLADLQTNFYLNCPSNIEVDAPSGTNSVVIYPAPEGTPGTWITSTPASGSLFPAGTNVVIATLVYGTNTLTCSFTVTVRIPPFVTVNLQTPNDGAVMQAGANLQLLAAANADPFNSITSVTFLSFGNVIGVVTNAPYSLSLTNALPGNYVFQTIAQQSSGLRATSGVANVASAVFVQNGGFETGDFTGWTLVGTPDLPGGSFYNGVPQYWDRQVQHSGRYGAYLGDIQVASLSQTFWTSPGQGYLLSLWLNNPISGTNQLFSVGWNTNTPFGIINPPAFGWTNVEFFVMGSGPNTTLQIHAENDPGYFGLDDIRLTPTPLPTLQSAALLANGAQLSWLTAPGTLYQIQFKTDLLQGSWYNLIPAFVATDYSFTLLDTNAVSSSQRFYRLVLP